MLTSTGDVTGMKTEQNINKRGTERKSKSFDLDMSQLIFSSVKGILEKDQYNLLETKAIQDYDRKIKLVDTKIKRLIELNSQGKDQLKKLQNSTQVITSENTKKLNAITGRLT